MNHELDVIPTRIRTVTEGGHTVKFVEIVGPIPVHIWEPPPRPRMRLNPVNDLAQEDGR